MCETVRKQNKWISKGERKQAGFSLVELMVSLTVFSVVVLIALGTLLVMIDVNAKAQALFSSNTNLSFALDAMSREIRTGYDYYCTDTNSGATLPSQSFNNEVPNDAGGNDCSDGDYITFTRERDGRRFGYQHVGNEIIQIVEPVGGGQESFSITSIRDVSVNNFSIDVRNTSPGDNDSSQPTVTLYIDGFSYNGLDTQTDFNIQTQITQRRLDI